MLAHLPGTSRYWLAYSGGMDSHVLLHAMAALREQLPNVAVHAVHVNHGLQAPATQWADHCALVSQALNVPFQLLHINARAASGESPEAAARHARYEAFCALIKDGDCLLTAHHQDDQAETLLLQLLRGAGLQGLASMPRCAHFGEGWHARPLLEFSRSMLRDYAQRQHLHWIDDHSNRNTDFDRNYLRHNIVPTLRERWPAMAQTLSRSARHAAEAADLLAVLAHNDLQFAGGPQTDTLSIACLETLEPARQRNMLRHWIKQLDLPLPGTTHIEQIVKDVIGAARDSVCCVRWPGAEVRRYRDLLYAMSSATYHDSSLCVEWDLRQPLSLSDGLQLSATPIQGAGLDTVLCLDQKITVRFRQGGERCRPVGRKHTHALKKLFQERGIPPWQRKRIPLIYVNDQLAAVTGLWVCQPFQAQGNALGMQVMLTSSKL
jgi:tRNA(Ile)-lysidine synthase